MLRQSWRITFAGLLLAAAPLACNFNTTNNTASPTVTVAAMTAENSQGGETIVPPLPDTATPTFIPTTSPAPSQTPSLSGNALVAASALCLLGPGKGYDVSSSIGGGTRVDLLGRSPIDGWWIIRNPRYHDPCWIQAIYLQIDIDVNVSTLPIYQVPPTSTPTP